MKEKTPLLCIDAGATNTRLAIWDGTSLGPVHKIKTPHGGQELWIETLGAVIAAFRIDSAILAIAGPVDRNETILCAHNIWGTAPLEKEKLENRWQVKLTVLNDLTAALLRYAYDPLFENCERLLLTTVSTGIAAKLFVKTSGPFLDSSGISGEIGKAIVHGPQTKACLEELCSGRGIIRLAKEMGVVVRSADELTLHWHVVQKSCELLASVLQAVFLCYAPDRCILMGGFAEHMGERYRLTLIDALAALPLFHYTKKQLQNTLVFGVKDDLNGLLGAALSAQIT